MENISGMVCSQARSVFFFYIVFSFSHFESHVLVRIGDIFISFPKFLFFSFWWSQYYVWDLYFLNHCICCAYSSLTDCRRRTAHKNTSHRNQATSSSRRPLAGTRFPGPGRVSSQYESVLQLLMIDLGRRDVCMRQLANRTKWLIIRGYIV